MRTMILLLAGGWLALSGCTNDYAALRFHDDPGGGAGVAGAAGAASAEPGGSGGSGGSGGAGGSAGG